jgi:ABC-type dipeptide/oligopeptide/nickel transport system permease component
MQTYILRRLAALVPTLFFASLIVFVTVRLIPGNVIDLMLSQNDIAVGKDRAALEVVRALTADAAVCPAGAPCRATWAAHCGRTRR